MATASKRTAARVLALGLLCLGFHLEAQTSLTGAPAANTPPRSTTPKPKLEDYLDHEGKLDRNSASNFFFKVHTSQNETNASFLAKVDVSECDYLQAQRNGEAHPKPPYPHPEFFVPDDVLRVVKAQPGKDTPPQWPTIVSKHLLLRATYQDINTIQDPQNRQATAEADKAANPATASFFRNYSTGSNAWTIKASLVYLANVNSNLLVDGDRDQLIAGVSVDREFNNQSEAHSVDSLIFRLGDIYQYWGKSTNCNFGTLRFAGDYATDTSFNSLVAGAELDYRPDLGFFNCHEWLGGWRPLQGYGYYLPAFGSGALLGTWAPRVSWNAALHSEYGYTVRQGNKAQLAGDPNSFRLGPVASVSVQPFPALSALNLRALTVNISYEYLGGIVSGPNSSHDFKVQATYPFIPGVQNVSLTVAYENGLAPILKDKVNTLTVGLGVKL